MSAYRATKATMPKSKLRRLCRVFFILRFSWWADAVLVLVQLKFKVGFNRWPFSGGDRVNGGVSCVPIGHDALRAQYGVQLRAEPLNGTAALAV